MADMNPNPHPIAGSDLTDLTESKKAPVLLLDWQDADKYGTALNFLDEGLKRGNASGNMLISVNTLFTWLT